MLRFMFFFEEQEPQFVLLFLSVSLLKWRLCFKERALISWDSVFNAISHTFISSSLSTGSFAVFFAPIFSFLFSILLNSLGKCSRKTSMPSLLDMKYGKLRVMTPLLSILIDTFLIFGFLEIMIL